MFIRGNTGRAAFCDSSSLRVSKWPCLPTGLLQRWAQSSIYTLFGSCRFLPTSRNSCDVVPVEGEQRAVAKTSPDQARSREILGRVPRQAVGEPRAGTGGGPALILSAATTRLPVEVPRSGQHNTLGLWVGQPCNTIHFAGPALIHIINWSLAIADSLNVRERKTARARAVNHSNSGRRTTTCMCTQLLTGG